MRHLDLVSHGRSNRVRLLVRASLSLGLLASLGVLAVAGATGPQQPTFRSAVDLIAVDVAVVDRDGRPVPGLAPSKFEVTIDGRRRRVVSADLVQYSSQVELAESARRVSRGGGMNLLPSDAPSRTFLLAIDTVSFSAGESAVVAEAARRFVRRLPTNDLIGVFALPRGAFQSPTADRVAVGRALDSAIGVQNIHQGQYHLTASEVVDITAADGEMPGAVAAPATGRASQAVSPAMSNDTLQQVQMRECRSTVDRTCTMGIVLEAQSTSRLYEEAADATLSSLDDMLRLLSTYPAARRTVVLISGGIPVSDRQGGWHNDGGQARQLGHSAARANATVYSLHVDRGYGGANSAEARRPRQGTARERELEEMLLGEFALASGGALISAPTGSPDAALDRLLVETSAYYLLGVAPDALDLDGNTHSLKVNVAAKGVSVRSRQYVLLPRAR